MLTKMIVKDEAKVEKLQNLLQDTNNPKKIVSLGQYGAIADYFRHRDSLSIEQNIIDLQTNLLANTDTEVSIPVFVSLQPVYPNTMLSLIYGALFGLMVGIIVVLVKASFKVKKQ